LFSQVDLCVLCVFVKIGLFSQVDVCYVYVHTAIHMDVRTSYRPRLLVRLYEVEACDVSRQVRACCSVCCSVCFSVFLCVLVCVLMCVFCSNVCFSLF